MKEKIDLDFLQILQDRLSKEFQIASLITDKNGIPLTTPSNFSDICLLIRTNQEANAKCKICDSYGGQKAMQLKKTIIYKCHIGLTDFASPIIINDNLIGCFLCGQIVTKNEDIEIVTKNLEEKKIISPEIKKHLDQLKVVSIEEIDIVAKFLYNISSKVSEYVFYQDNVIKNQKSFDSKLLILKEIENNIEIKDLTVIEKIKKSFKLIF